MVAVVRLDADVAEVECDGKDGRDIDIGSQKDPRVARVEAHIDVEIAGPALENQLVARAHGLVEPELGRVARVQVPSAGRVGVEQRRVIVGVGVGIEDDSPTQEGFGGRSFQKVGDAVIVVVEVARIRDAVAIRVGRTGDRDAQRGHVGIAGPVHGVDQRVVDAVREGRTGGERRDRRVGLVHHIGVAAVAIDHEGAVGSVHVAPDIAVIASHGENARDARALPRQVRHRADLEAVARRGVGSVVVVDQHCVHGTAEQDGDVAVCLAGWHAARSVKHAGFRVLDRSGDLRG